MSDSISPDEFEALAERVTALEQENSELRSRLETAENRLDHYQSQMTGSDDVSKRISGVESRLDSVENRLDHAGDGASLDGGEDRLAVFESEVESRLDSIENRLDHYQQQLGSKPSGSSGGDGGSGPSFGDQRDQRVLVGLQAGDNYKTGQLRSYYREHTDMVKKSTIKRRVEKLTDSRLFEPVGPGLFQFQGE